MPFTLYKPDTSSSPGYCEGQEHLPTSYVDTNSYVLQLLDRVDSLEKLVCRLQEQLHQLQSSVHTSHELKHPSHAQQACANYCHLVTDSTQTANNSYVSPMDFESLTKKIGQCQNEDGDIRLVKYFINHNIIPETNEILNFQPRTRRYLWQLSRFVVQDDIVYRKRMAADCI